MLKLAQILYNYLATAQIPVRAIPQIVLLPLLTTESVAQK